MQYTFTLSVEEVNLLTRSLGKLSIDDGLALVLKLDMLITEQNRAASAERAGGALEVSPLNGSSPHTDDTLESLA